MYSQNIRNEFWYCRAAETVKFGFFVRRWAKNASTSPAATPTDTGS